jgi:hypothetical protein
MYNAKMFVSAFQYPEKGVLRPKKDELKVFLYRVLPGVFLVHFCKSGTKAYFYN